LNNGTGMSSNEWRVTTALPKGKYAYFPNAEGTVGYFISISTITVRSAFGTYASLRSIMTMASHGRRVSLPSRCLRGEGIFGRPEVAVERPKRSEFYHSNF
jgi:hypothetical protein